MSGLRFGKAWILLPLGMIAGLVFTVVFLYFRYTQERSQDSRYNIVAVVQCCQQGEGVRTSLLTELLQLSIDAPTNLYSLNTDQAQQLLLNCPVFLHSEIKKIMPGTLYIEYSLRKPIAYLHDYSNTAIDEQGMLLPFNPFYTPKNIPELIVGFEFPESTPVWGTILEGQKAQLAFSLLKAFDQHFAIDSCSIHRIDISKAFLSSCGQREIVVSLEERIEKINLLSSRRILRLSTEQYPKELANYLLLRQRLNEQLMATKDSVPTFSNLIIDMRIPNLAFIDYID